MKFGEASALLGAKARRHHRCSKIDTLMTLHTTFAPGGFAAANSGLLGGHLTFAAEAEAGGLWREVAARRVRGGPYLRHDRTHVHQRARSATRDRQARKHVSFRLLADGREPRADQYLVWTGFDANVWSNFANFDMAES